MLHLQSSECCLVKDLSVLIRMNAASRDAYPTKNNESTRSEKPRLSSRWGKSRTNNRTCKCCITCYFLGVVRCPSAKRLHPKETSWACTRWARLLLPSPASGSSVGCERNLGQQLRQEQHVKGSVCKRLTSPLLQMISDYLSDITVTSDFVKWVYKCSKTLGFLNSE